MGSTSTRESLPLLSPGTASGKRMNVAVCSCSQSNTVEGLIQMIRRNMGDVVQSVRFEPLPYNIRDMNEFDFSEIDVLLLCHSIENRRFSLTDVTDALYDGFLPRARYYLGESRVGVIAHDFPIDALTPDNITSRMESIRHTQRTTFNHSSLVLIGGQLSQTPVDLKDDQLNQIKWFFHKASIRPCSEAFEVHFYRCFLGCITWCCCCFKMSLGGRQR